MSMKRRDLTTKIAASLLGWLCLTATVAGQCDPDEIFLEVNPTYPVGGGQWDLGPHSVAIGDLNDDTYPDLVALSLGVVSVLLGNGDGTFAPYVAYPTSGYGSASVLIGDCTGLVYNLLSGDMTMRFLLKATTVGVIAGTAFIYYLSDLRRDERELGA